MSMSRPPATARDAWNLTGAGYQEMAETLRPAVEQVLEIAGVRPGHRVLDVATGTGIAAIGAARRGATVVGLDFAGDLLTEARRLSAAAGLDATITFVEGDARALPFADAAFDVVLSSFGAIFAPEHDVVAREMARVARPGGTLSFSAWKPEGPNLRLMTFLVPWMSQPPAGGPGPLSWGCRDYIEERFAPYAGHFRYIDGNVPWRADSISDAIDMLFRRALGPTARIFQSLDARGQLAAHDAAIALLRNHLDPDGRLDLARHYLASAAIRR